MRIGKKSQLIEFFVFVITMLLAVGIFNNDKLAVKIDSFILPEERNKGYYDILNKPSEWQVCEELSDKGTKNLLANYLKSGERKEGYSITVNPDGTFIFEGTYSGENNKYESITPTGIGFDLPTGDYILSDGDASTENGVSVKLTGAKRMIGGEIKYFTLAHLPGNGSFHWDRDPDVELYCEIVIRPGTSFNELKFSPMLLNKEDAGSQEYQACTVKNYDWDECENENGEGVKFYRYDVYKGALDGEIVTRDDWKIFVNSLRFQMQADRAVINLKDGYGIEFLKQDYPKATYGKLNVSMSVMDGKEVNIEDYDGAIKTESSESDLKNIRDFYSYLKALDNCDYTILISIKDDGVASLNRETVELFRKFGMQTDLSENEEEKSKGRKYYRNSYYGVFRLGKSEAEKADEEKLYISGSFSDGKEYIIESAGQKTGESKASIKIDGDEYAMNLRGMNFVIYDEEEHKVVDSVCFDTAGGFICHRQPEQ